LSKANLTVEQILLYYYQKNMMKIKQYYSDFITKIKGLIPKKILEKIPEKFSRKFKVIFYAIIGVLVLGIVGLIIFSPKKTEKDIGFSKIQPMNVRIREGISAHISIHGKDNSKANIKIYNEYGEFTSFELTPDNELINVSYYSGPQKIIVHSMILVPPTEFSKGFIIINCEFSDIMGNGLQIFSGKIAKWKW
jgi:hypothetical protein